MAIALRSISLSIPRNSSPPRRGGARSVSPFFRHPRPPPFLLRASSAPSHANGSVGSRRDADPVEVIGIGSRKDAVIDFCSSSRSVSSSLLRFWTIYMRDSSKVQLLQRCHGTGVVLRDVEFPLALHPCPSALILVASAGHGLDHITAIELLNAVKSEGGLTISIFLKPFSFEGQRRQEEADDLINRLHECSHLHIVVEADSLLKKEAETLAEALESANNAVLLALTTISIMFLASYGEAKFGFGAGYSIKSAITEAVFHCPFLCGGIKGLNSVAIITLTSASVLDKSDLVYIMNTFLRVTEFSGEIIFSNIHEPDLEPNLLVITLLTAGCDQNIVSQKKGFLSSLAVHFPFLLSLMGRDDLGTRDNKSVLSPREFAESVFSLPDKGCSSSLDSVNGAVDPPNAFIDKKAAKRPRIESTSRNKRSENEEVEASEFISEKNKQTNGGFQWDSSLRNFGPGFHIAQLWAKERATLNGSIKIDELDTFTLPVGVKSSEFFYNPSQPRILDESGGESSGIQNAPSQETFADAGLEAMTEIYNTALILLKGRKVDESRKRGLLSVRAASMLEAERESEKSWTPVLEIQYRGGTFRGRCQGGLPEGKGRLTFVDGSFYDGMWRGGKRSGLGTLYYSNGDVFHGTWRDDLMHGKGWFYFRGGDRWFANFWKGRANGEGRFYSQNGSVLFGQFRNGWRHGESLWIDADGSRWNEVWDEGILVCRTKLDEELPS
ncbi:Protein ACCUMULATION AND REPLICATION OF CHLOROPLASTS 3 [Ananas comosus]|uniref:Protein ACCUMULATION AND REPLICATION OF CHLOROPLASTS 3 n=1 Tax=Ananas comosus TaxID=4615 RepID=A0A199UE52_ANACO|nr:Protein ACCUMULATION AND REPLICATION OF CHLOROPLASTS 3 [Ananas comosus]